MLSLLSVSSGSRFALGIAWVGRHLDPGQKHFLFVDIGLEGERRAPGECRNELVGSGFRDFGLDGRLGSLRL